MKFQIVVFCESESEIPNGSDPKNNDKLKNLRKYNFSENLRQAIDRQANQQVERWIDKKTNIQSYRKTNTNRQEQLSKPTSLQTNKKTGLKPSVQEETISACTHAHTHTHIQA